MGREQETGEGRLSLHHLDNGELHDVRPGRLDWSVESLLSVRPSLAPIPSISQIGIDEPLPPREAGTPEVVYLPKLLLPLLHAGEPLEEGVEVVLSLHVGLGPVGNGEVRRLRFRTFWRLLGYPLLPRRGPGRRGVEILEGTIGKRVPVDTEETLVASRVRDDAGQDTELDLIEIGPEDLRLSLGVPKVLPPFSSLIESLKMRVRSGDTSGLGAVAVELGIDPAPQDGTPYEVLHPALLA